MQLILFSAYKLTDVFSCLILHRDSGILKNRKQADFGPGGRGGIRTHGCLHIAGFQDRCIRPLCHPSRNNELYRNFGMLSELAFPEMVLPVSGRNIRSKLWPAEVVDRVCAHVWVTRYIPTGYADFRFPRYRMLNRFINYIRTDIDKILNE